MRKHMKTALIIDVQNLAYRALYSVGKLEFNGTPTGVLYGMYRTLDWLHYEYQVSEYAFCFDTRYPKRAEMYPEYKENRKLLREKEPEKKRKEREGMYEQVRAFYDLLPKMGAKNVFAERGYEADDLMASCVENLPDDIDRAFLVTSDEDLRQCLQGHRVYQYMPSKKATYSERQLLEEYGIVPAQIPCMKAWAGCSSDNIEGLRNIGPKKACQFLLGKYPKPEHFTDHVETYTRNIQLTRLPLPGTPKCKWTLGSPISWEPVLELIGADAKFPPFLKGVGYSRKEPSENE